MSYHACGNGKLLTPEGCKLGQRPDIGRKNRQAIDFPRRRRWAFDLGERLRSSAADRVLGAVEVVQE